MPVVVVAVLHCTVLVCVVVSPVAHCCCLGDSVMVPQVVASCSFMWFPIAVVVLVV